MNANQTLKFQNDYHLAFLGADGWSDEQKPFFCETDDFVVIVDSQSGVTVYFNVDAESQIFFASGKPFQTFAEAYQAVQFLQTFTAAQFQTMAETLFQKIEF